VYGTEKTMVFSGWEISYAAGRRVFASFIEEVFNRFEKEGGAGI